MRRPLRLRLFFSTEAKAVVAADQFDAVVKQIEPILNSTEKITSKKVNGEWKIVNFDNKAK